MEPQSKSLTSNSISLSGELLHVDRYQCMGKKFIEFYSKSKQHGDFSNASSESNISDDNSSFEVDVDYLRSLDPKEWKEQDHYAVLGLKKLRYDLLLRLLDQHFKSASNI